MKHNWETKKLSTVLTQYREEIWVNDTKEYLQVTNSKYDGIVLRGKKMGIEIGRKRQFVVNLDRYPHTITFTRQTIQVDEAIGLCPPEVNGCIVTENMPLFSVENAEPKFVEYFFRTRLFLDQLKKTAALGTSQQSVHEDIFLSYEIPLPTRLEQKQIVSKIESVKLKREEIQQLRSEQEIELINLKYSIYCDAEKDFENVPLSSLLTFSDNWEKPTAGTIYRQMGVRVWAEGGYERETIEGSQTQYSFFMKVEADDLVINKIWVRNGALAVVPKELNGCFVSTEFPTFKYDHNILNPKWIGFLIKQKKFWELCDVKSFGTSGKNRIKPEQFLKIEIPLPPIEEQNRIVSLLDKLNEVKTNHTQTEKELTQLLPSLLDKAFKGEL